MIIHTSTWQWWWQWKNPLSEQSTSCLHITIIKSISNRQHNVHVTVFKYMATWVKKRSLWGQPWLHYKDIICGFVCVACDGGLCTRTWSSLLSQLFLSPLLELNLSAYQPIKWEVKPNENHHHRVKLQGSLSVTQEAFIWKLADLCLPSAPLPEEGEYYI